MSLKAAMNRYRFVSTFILQVMILSWERVNCLKSIRMLFNTRSSITGSYNSYSSSSYISSNNPYSYLITTSAPSSSSSSQALYATKRNSNSNNEPRDNSDLSKLEENMSQGPTINWYPGHIAKSERELADYLKKVDVVIEVRDARIPLATTHPNVPTWVGNKPLIVAIARLDQISSKALADWREYYAIHPAHPERPDAKVYFVDGKLGAGVLTLKKQALKAGIVINEKRVRRGIQPRAVRAAVIGYPNVGKSALINRLLGRKMAKSRNLPGVTRQLQWVRLGGDQGDQLENTIELLDSPGIIPAQQVNQLNAIKLAVCNDIGEASYDRVVVAAHMCDLINKMHATGNQMDKKNYVKMPKIIARYSMPFNTMSGEEIVYEVGEKFYQGNLISAADRLLGDFRRGMLGEVSLESAPLAKTSANTGSSKVADSSTSSSSGGGLRTRILAGNTKSSSTTTTVLSSNNGTDDDDDDDDDDDEDTNNNEEEDEDGVYNSASDSESQYISDTRGDMKTTPYLSKTKARKLSKMAAESNGGSINKIDNNENNNDENDDGGNYNDDGEEEKGDGSSSNSSNKERKQPRVSLDIGRGNYEGW